MCCPVLCCIMSQETEDLDKDNDWQSGKLLVETNRIMLENEFGTDVTFVFSESKQKIKAHKFILMSRSRVFFVMFSHAQSMGEPEKDITIKDIEPAIFKDLLRFLYCEEDNITSENALHLLYSAQKYQVEQLKAKCLEFLQTNLDVTTVGLILDQAVFYNETRLHRKCLDFFSNHSVLSIKQLNEYHITKETLEVILACESVIVDELCIISACDEWAKVECKNKKLKDNPENKRKVLGSVLTKIRFCGLTNEEIATHVSPKGLLRDEDELAIFRYISAPASTEAPFPAKERVSVHAMLPSELGKGPGSTMLHLFNITNTSFHINVTCTKEFKLLGFFFTKAGNFKIILNDEILDEFIVPKPHLNMFLAQAVSCDTNKALDIREVSVDENAHKRNETYTFTCKARVDRKDNVPVTYSVKRYDLIEVPFNALILAL